MESNWGVAGEYPQRVLKGVFMLLYAPKCAQVLWTKRAYYEEGDLSSHGAKKILRRTQKSRRDMRESK